MKTIHYVNLTNGIEKIPELEDFRFIRIQSSHCEEKKFDLVLRNLSDDFILNCLLGHQINIYDFGARKEIPRAVWQGVEWIKYIFNLYFLDIETIPITNGVNCLKYFQEQSRKLPEDVKKKLSYHKKFVSTTSIKINCITTSTTHDGDTKFFQKILWEVSNAKEDFEKLLKEIRNTSESLKQKGI